MLLTPDQLAKHLQQPLCPIYWVSGDEPFQIQEATDRIRQAAVQQGYTQRERLIANKTFDWQQLLQTVSTLSLFAEKRLVEIQLDTNTPGKVGSQILVEALAVANDTVILVCSTKLEKHTQTAKWYKAIEQQGVVIPVWPIAAEKMPTWLQQRAQQYGLQLPLATVKLLTIQVEGNLLAAAQEIEKLALLHNSNQAHPVQLTEEQLMQSISDSSRYTVYELADSVLLGKTERTLRILRSLQAEGTAVPLILWVISQELQSMVQYSQRLTGGESQNTVLSGVWSSRKTAIATALKRLPLTSWTNLLQQCAEVDQISKGLRAGKEWFALSQLCLQACGLVLANK